MMHSAALQEAGQYPAATFLSTWPAAQAQRRFGLAIIVLSFLLFGALAPFAKLVLPQFWAFIPVYESALVVIDLTTALLLVGQFRATRSKAVLVLASGYLFGALVTVSHGLSFPGLITPDGLLATGPQTTAWLYMFWHGGFPLFVIGYAALRGSAREAIGASVPDSLAILAAGVGATLVVIALVLIATAGHDVLPAIMQGSHYTPAMTATVSCVWLSSLVALAVLWRRRPPSVLDLWLMVAMCAWLLDIAMSAMLNAGRFDLGFYAGRAYGLLANSFVLGALLLEHGRLYTRLLQAHTQQRQRAADLERLSDQLESLNAQLGQSNRQLQEQTRLKSEFLANMSHELRTPLNAIIGFSEMLKGGMVADVDNQRRFAGHIFQSGHHLLALINDILDLSKIEAGKVEIALEPVDLQTILDETFALLANQVEAKHIRLKLDQYANASTFLADRRRVKQILLNLLSNAIKFTPEGGLVTVRVDLVERTRAASALPGFGEGVRMPIPASDFKHFIEISVSDTGIGMTSADMGRLFTPFTQIANSMTRAGEGTGLGLVMVHRLAELHAGCVAVTSERGRGSCFSVWLPQRVAAKSSAQRDESSPPVLGLDAEQRSGRSVALVVEDNEDTAALMRAQLEANGFVVRQAVSAEAALALVDDFTPSVITLDILLPGMDGWEFLARLRETPRWEGVPVVVVSVVADRGRGFSLGAALVLQKPIGSEALAKGLERLGLMPNRGREVSILVIDDDAGAVELLATQLRQRDYVVLRALGGREGIELARRFRPNLIALDLEMPDVNGFDVVEALKDDPSTAHIPIVVVTAKDLAASDREQLNGHILEIVGKSDFNHGRFIGEVQRALAKPA
jgi:signal transduction histidine kinase/DNA-binding response OmpR family regulator